jgi:hypothetical protein
MQPESAPLAVPSPPRRPWQPIKHSVFVGRVLADRLHVEGITIVPFVDAGQIDALRALYLETHQIPQGNGGLFYSVYSRDYQYRARVDRELRSILTPSFARYFHNYDNVINMFVVKTPGPASEFPIHQDTTALDERVHSPLSVWLPLQTITRDSGGLAVVRRTHRVLSPYRSISFEPEYVNIASTIRRYLEPIEVPLGHAVIFDARILHCSLENRTNDARPVVVSGIFPQGSELVTCYREPRAGAPIELLRQPPEFLLRFPNFLHDCHARPAMGQLIGTVPIEDEPHPLSAEAFVASCRDLGIEPVNAMPPQTGQRCHMIGEPR